MRAITALLTGIVFIALAGFPHAQNTARAHSHGGIKAVSTTGIINDIVAKVGGDKVEARSLMGPGVDPHLYKATAGDIRTLAKADVIFYHGLHLEGKISDVLGSMKLRGVNTVAVTRDIPESELISTGKKASYDPHVWFDPKLWSFAVRTVARTLSEMDPENARFYGENAGAYMSELERLDAYSKTMSAAVPADKKILITSHDAFGYFGRAYEFKVTALQGVSTVSEAAISDVRDAVETITENRIPAIFTESSVSPRYIRAVKEAAEASGMAVKIGGKLYSDALGNKKSLQGTFFGMFKHNVDVICLSLSGGDAGKVALIRGETKSAQ